MSRVRIHMMMTLDGFVARPGLSRERPFGEGAEGFHDWLSELRSFQEMHGMEGGKTGPSDDVIREAMSNAGAWVIGHNMFGPWPEPWRGWWGEDPPFHTPVFVLTHQPRGSVEMQGGTVFHFVTDGIESALRQAREAAGDKDVRIGGGASTVNQYLAAGLLDEIELHIVPILFGDGPRLFEGLGAARPRLELARTVATPEVTHVKYRVVK